VRVDRAGAFDLLSTRRQAIARRSIWRISQRRLAGLGIIPLFEDWLRAAFRPSGALEPVLEPWWQSLPSGPFLYYPGRRHLPAPLRAFIDLRTAGRRPPLRR
jgi:DNA-binding transcriptional LysR family regulator